MPPIEAYFTIGGVKMDGEIIAKDGEIAVLNTPVGRAIGKVDPPNKSWLYGSLASRFKAAFPGEGEMTAGKLKEQSPDLVTRESTYRSQVGKVVIVFKATNSPPSKKQSLKSTQI